MPLEGSTERTRRSLSKALLESPLASRGTSQGASRGTSQDACRDRPRPDRLDAPQGIKWRPLKATNGGLTQRMLRCLSKQFLTSGEHRTAGTSRERTEAPQGLDGGLTKMRFWRRLSGEFSIVCPENWQSTDDRHLKATNGASSRTRWSLATCVPFDGLGGVFEGQEACWAIV